jgi:hypothetical protein
MLLENCPNTQVLATMMFCQKQVAKQPGNETISQNKHFLPKMYCQIFSHSMRSLANTHTYQNLENLGMFKQ